MSLERAIIEGENPVHEREKDEVRKSTIEHEKFGGNIGGPPPKAKYYHVTDSELVP